MGNKQDCAKGDHELPSKISTKPLSQPKPNTVLATQQSIKSPHSNKKYHHKQSLTDSTTPCSPLSAFSTPHCCDDRIHRLTVSAPHINACNMNQSLSHIDLKQSQSLHSFSPQAQKREITPSPSASPYSSLHLHQLHVPQITINGKRSWSEVESMTNPYSMKEDESESDTESASTPWILYRTTHDQQPSLEQIHHEVMLSEPPSPSQSVCSYEHNLSLYNICDQPKKSSTSELMVEYADIQ